MCHPSVSELASSKGVCVCVTLQSVSPSQLASDRILLFVYNVCVCVTSQNNENLDLE